MAQLVARLHGMQKVRGSNPLTSTSQKARSIRTGPSSSSGSCAGPGLDRHWRNARVLASHTPLPHRRRQIGECLLHGTPAPHSADAVETASSTGADPSRDSASPSPSTPAAPKEQ